MCPLCHSKRVRRSRRKPVDFLLVLLGAKPMRCRTCSYRHYKWPWSQEDQPALPAQPMEEGAPLAGFKVEKPSAAAAGSGNP